MKEGRRDASREGYDSKLLFVLLWGGAARPLTSGAARHAQRRALGDACARLSAGATRLVARDDSNTLFASRRCCRHWS